jgi:hypothetical protein
MRAFAEAFFTCFGAHTFPLDDEMVVDLPPDLAAVFGKPRLYLVFAEDDVVRELSPAEDLLVYGSRIFDQMLALLEGRGEATYLHLPAQFPGEPTDAPPLPLHNCQLVECQSHTADAQFYIYNFRVAYVSDEKREEFVTIVLDVAGLPRPDKTGMLADGTATVPSYHPSATQPEMLRRWLGRAGEIARQQADARAVELQAAIQPRLQKALLRLTSFYRRMSEEVDTGDSAQDTAARADLERDLARKLADELERHRLRITLTPLSYAIAWVPTAYYQLVLATRHTRHHVALERDLYTGQPEPLPCHHCGETVQRLALCDRADHLVHPQCLDTCPRCGRDICHACGIQPCALCGSPVCFDCVAVCARCDRWLCAGHLQTCAVCGEPVCGQCAAVCGTCDVAQCRDHLVPCLACGALTCEEDRWPCHICGRESCPVHADTCPICGEPYCVEHSLRCKVCGQVYCGQCGAESQCRTCRPISVNPVITASVVPRVPGISPALYRWRRAENRDFVVYLGQRWLGEAVIVANRAGAPVYHSKSGLFQILFKGLSR